MVNKETKIFQKIVIWHENAQVSNIRLYTSEGLIDGQISYFKNGQQKVQFEMKNGLVWNSKSWKPNGEPVEEAVVNGNGKSITYQDNGDLGYIEPFKNGKLQGIAVVYGDQGRIVKKWSYKDGEANGDVVTYGDEGRIVEKMTYKNGEPNGDWLIYDSNGNISSKYTYKNGELIEPFPN